MLLGGGEFWGYGLVACFVRNMDLREQTESVPQGQLLPKQNELCVSKISRFTISNALTAGQVGGIHVSMPKSSGANWYVPGCMLSS